jgi:hypothetical protein
MIGSFKNGPEGGLVAADLALLFESLVLPLAQPSGNNLSAVVIPGSETHRLAKDADGVPCLLLRQPAGTTRPGPIRLQNLMVSYDVPCTITQPSGTQEHDNFTIIKCSSADPRLFPHFLGIVSPVVIALGATPTSAAVRRTISGLVELFQALTAPAKKSIQGIWAELFLIVRASSPISLVSAWHVVPGDRYDFSAGVERIEVKSASGRVRQHHFSLEQLYPPAGTRLLVASLFIERAGGGTSLEDLLSTVRQSVSSKPELIVHVDHTTYKALGNSWQHALEERFDLELAEESLAFFEAERIPRLPEELPRGVSEVRFRSDLSGQPAVDPRLMLPSSGLFRAVLPK